MNNFNINNINDLTELTLVLTEECNLMCSYCNQQHLTTKMTENDINKLIDFFKKIKIENLSRMLNIELFGGEPFLNIQIIEKLILFLDDVLNEDQKRKVNFKITSNGTIYNDYIKSMLQHFCKNYSFELKFSYDGLWQNERSDKEIEKIIINNINKFMDLPQRYRMYISFSVFKNNKIIDNYKFIKNRINIPDARIKWYLIREPQLWSKELFENLKPELNKFFEYNKNLLYATGEVTQKLWEDFNEWYKYELTNEVSLGCNMGYTRFTVLPNFQFSACSLANNFKVQNKVPFETIENNCKTCEIFYNCNKICPLKITYKDNSLNNSNFYCEIKKYYFKLFHENYLFKYPIFSDYINNSLIKKEIK